MSPVDDRNSDDADETPDDASEFDVTPGLSIREFEELSAKDPDDLTDLERAQLTRAEESINAMYESIQSTMQSITGTLSGTHKDTMEKVSKIVASSTIVPPLPSIEDILDERNAGRMIQDHFEEIDFTPGWAEPLDQMSENMNRLVQVATVQKAAMEAAEARARAAEDREKRAQKVNARRFWITFSISAATLAASIIVPFIVR